MEFFGNIIKGVMIGIANIIPGVSGGTMAVSLGIYDRLIGAVSGLFKEFKKNIAFLIPIIIGCGIGIVGFTYAIEYLLDKHTFVTCMAFVGLILGGLPAIISSMKSKMTSGGIGVFGILAFVIAFVISGGMPLLKESKDALTVIAVTPVNMVSFKSMRTVCARAWTAIPARTMEEWSRTGERAVSPRERQTARRAPKNAKSVVDGAAAETNRIAKAAPALAPEETPMMSGDASGFRKTVW